MAEEQSQTHSTGLRPHDLHCFASPGWSWGFAVSAAVEGEEHPSGPRQWGTLWNTVEHILCSWSCWDVWLPSYSKGDVLLCLGSLEGVGCAAAPISGHGKTHRHPPARPGSSGLWGVTWQWGHPMRVCIPHCTPLLTVREEDFPQCVTRVPPMPASLPFGGT